MSGIGKPFCVDPWCGSYSFRPKIVNPFVYSQDVMIVRHKLISGQFLFCLYDCSHKTFRVEIVVLHQRRVLWITEEFLLNSRFLFFFCGHCLIALIKQRGQAFEVITCEIFIEHKSFIIGTLGHVVETFQHRPKRCCKSFLDTISRIYIFKFSTRLQHFKYFGRHIRIGTLKPNRFPQHTIFVRISRYQMQPECFFGRRIRLVSDTSHTTDSKW